MTPGRSGSNTLRDMRNMHPQVYSIGQAPGSWTKARNPRGRGSRPAGRARGIRYDPTRIADMLTTIVNENAEMDRMLSELPAKRCMVIHYEELFRNPESRQKVMNGVFAFLGVAPVPVATTMKKIIADPVHEAIEDFDDCLAAVRGTRFEAILRDDTPDVTPTVRHVVARHASRCENVANAQSCGAAA